MAIPVTITNQLADLQTAFDAASPIDTAATRSQILGLQFRAAQLVAACDATLPAAAGALDTATVPDMPTDMVKTVLALLQSAQDQTVLAEVRGLIGRAASNLDQVMGK